MKAKIEIHHLTPKLSDEQAKKLAGSLLDSNDY